MSEAIGKMAAHPRRVANKRDGRKVREKRMAFKPSDGLGGYFTVNGTSPLRPNRYA